MAVEISEGIVLDYDVDGSLVDIDIGNAASKVALDRLSGSNLPGKVDADAA